LFKRVYLTAASLELAQPRTAKMDMTLSSPSAAKCQSHCRIYTLRHEPLSVQAHWRRLLQFAPRFWPCHSSWKSSRRNGRHKNSSRQSAKQFQRQVWHHCKCIYSRQRRVRCHFRHGFSLLSNQSYWKVERGTVNVRSWKMKTLSKLHFRASIYVLSVGTDFPI